MAWDYVSRSRSKDTSNPYKDTPSYLRKTWSEPGVVVNAAYRPRFRMQCADPPSRGGWCLSPRGLVSEVYGIKPIRLQVQIYYFDTIDQKGYWYTFRYTGSKTSATYNAWDKALNSASRTSNVRWVVRKWDKPWQARNGYAPANVQKELFTDAYALTRPVLLRKIALRNQTERTIKKEQRDTTAAREALRQADKPATISPLLLLGAAAGAYFLYKRA